MKKPVLNILIFALAIFSLFSCDDDIFWKISEETPKLKPLIQGSPTNFVEISNTTFVASGRTLWAYADKKWSTKPLPFSKRIVQLAGSGTNILYMFLYDDSNGSRSIAKLTYSSGALTGSELSPFPSGFVIQSIFVANNTLFVGAQNGGGGSFAIFSSDSFTTVNTGSESPGLLNGAAYSGSTYYLCTQSGIFSGSSATSVTRIADSDKKFTGIISHGTTVMAITRDGELYTVGSSLTLAGSFGSRYSTGALGIYTKGSDSLLLAGRQDSLNYSTTSGYTHGYLERTLSGTDAGFREPGQPGTGEISSVDSNDRYVSSLGINPVNHIFQASDGTLFASTQKNGVWSLRERDGIVRWNAEDKADHNTP